MRRGVLAIGILLACVSTAPAAPESKPIELLLDNGYEIIEVIDAGDPRVDVIYLKKGRSHVVCKYIPFGPDWSPLGESTCVTLNYATE